MHFKRDRSILEINVLYFVTALLLLTVGAFIQGRNVKIGLLITEYILILLPPLIYLKIKGSSMVEYLRLNKLRLKHGILVICITILSYPVALFLNSIILTLLSFLGPIKQPPIPVANTYPEYLILMFIIAVSPGICEEIFFRGMLLRGYERLGVYPSIAITSLLFGIFHFNVQNLVGPVFLGVLFGYLVIKTDSLFAGIIGHITNNGLAVTIGYLANAANERAIQENISLAQQMPGSIQLIIGTVFIGMIAVLTGLGAFALIRIILRDMKGMEIKVKEINDEEEQNRFSFLHFIPVYLVIAFFVILGYLQVSSMIVS